jgi:hypothetical protein
LAWLPVGSNYTDASLESPLFCSRPVGQANRYYPIAGQTSFAKHTQDRVLPLHWTSRKLDPNNAKSKYEIGLKNKDAVAGVVCSGQYLRFNAVKLANIIRAFSSISRV